MIGDSNRKLIVKYRHKPKSINNYINAVSNPYEHT